MASPEDRQKRQRRRQRNFVAKRLREDGRFKQHRIPDKRHKLLEPAWQLKDGDIILNEDEIT